MLTPVRSLWMFLLAAVLASCAAAQPRYHEEWPALHQRASRQVELRSGPQPPFKEAWHFQTEGRLVYPPVVADGRVYLGSRDSAVYALDLATGAEIWQTPVDVGGLFSSPVLLNQRLYGGRWSPYYFIYAWDAATGKNLWQKETGDLVNRPPWILAQAFAGNEKTPPATVIYTHQDPPLGAPLEEQKIVQTAWRFPADLEAKPQLVWERPLPGVPMVPAALDPHQPLLFTALDNEVLYALQQSDGQVHWQQSLAGEPASAPLVVEDTLFLSTRNGYLYAFDTRSGALKWRYQFTNAALAGDLAIAEQTLYIPGERVLYTFDTRQREPGWKYSFPGLITAPVVTHENVYVGSSSRALFVLNREKGYITYTYPVGGEVLASPVLVAGKVLLSCTDGKLYVLEEGPRPQQVRPDQINQPVRKPSTSRW